MKPYKNPIFIVGILILLTGTTLQLLGKLGTEYVTLMTLVLTTIAGHDWARSVQAGKRATSV